MAMSVRLDRRTELILSRLARDRRRSKSDVVRESILTLARRKGGGNGGTGTAYDLLKPYLGVIRSGGRLLCGDRRAEIAAFVRKKHLAESAR
ncbi:MAG: hypothetical protein AAB152_04695 [Candidatus Coatesbacteria bacterium]